MCWYGWYIMICCYLRCVNKNKLLVGICIFFDIIREMSYKWDDIFDMVFIYNYLLFVFLVLLFIIERLFVEGVD